MSTQIILPRIMHVGKGASGQVAEVLTLINAKFPLIVTDQMMVKLGYTDKIQSALAAAGLKSEVFADTIPEPTVSSIMAGVEKARSQDFDAIIAIGGGSPIDSAKAISMLAKHGGEMRDYKVPHNATEAGLPIIAIPTTAGTGSEVTKFTVITDDSSDEKMLCPGIGFMPVAALVDFELTMSAPPRVTADSGLDALTHAMESYVSRKANPFSEAQSLAAMELIGRSLRTAYQNPSDEQARADMMLGSNLAGIAFSNASVALVHGMSRPIGAFFHVPHGLSNAMLLPTLTEYSIPSAQEKYARCAVAIGAADASDSVETACKKLIDELYALNRDLEVPGLKKFGVDEKKYFEVMPTMAQQALASGSPDNNPVTPDVDSMVELYKKIWNAA